VAPHSKTNDGDNHGATQAKISIKPGKSREPLTITPPHAAEVDIGSSVSWAEHSEAQHTGSDVLGCPLVSPIYRAMTRSAPKGRNTIKRSVPWDVISCGLFGHWLRKGENTKSDRKNDCNFKRDVQVKHSNITEI